MSQTCDRVVRGVAKSIRIIIIRRHPSSRFFNGRIVLDMVGIRRGVTNRSDRELCAHDGRDYGFTSNHGAHTMTSQVYEMLVVY